MENSLIESVLHVCRILNTHSVEYLIVGGTAVALHGYYRQSHTSSGSLAEKHDLDFWYNSTYDNYFRLLNALEDLDQDVAEFKAEATPNPKKSFFRIEFDKFTIDFLPELPGLSKFRSSFRIAYALSRSGDHKGVYRYELAAFIERIWQSAKNNCERIEIIFRGGE